MSFENYQPHLFPKLEAVGRVIGELVRHLPDSGYPSSHQPVEVAPQQTFDYQAYEHPTLMAPSVDGKDL